MDCQFIMGTWTAIYVRSFISPRYTVAYLAMLVSQLPVLEQLELLLPGYVAGGTAWRGHHLPLSGWRWDQAAGRVLLAGDVATLDALARELNETRTLLPRS